MKDDGRGLRTALLAAAGLALALVPLAGDYASSLVAEVLVFAIFAMSLDLLVGYTGLMSFGHAAFFGLSAYAVVTLGVHLGVGGWWGMLAGIALSTVAALAIGFFCIRVSGIPFLMLTMAFSQLLFSVAVKWRSVTGGTDGLPGFKRPSFFGWSLDDRSTQYWVIAVGFVLVWWGLRRLIASPLGSAMIGVRENEQRMRAIGYPVQRIKLIAFTIAGAVAGFGGALYAFFNAFVSSDILHWVLSGDGVLMVILGGAGTITGPIIGTALFLMLKHVVSSHTQYWMLWVGVVFIACVMFMRQGIWDLVLQQWPRWTGRRR
ncbi:branched-chain amino acid ABC transporter permease [Ramlibacter sp.]|uniref:branched-chain amino acid ABC transporter permease n=1 Tax=Ramlibacter sp. TaxID=1917967 RepID=UPI003D130260